MAADLSSLVASIQGLLIHDYYGGVLYGETPPGFESASRRTLSVRDRLAAIKSIEPAPLDRERPLSKRSVGTCRDYALLLCGFLRHHGIPARVRCGFAAYFQTGGFEDHWICEAWNDGDNRWIRVDAQLDVAHCKALSIQFSPLELPKEVFLTADEAWMTVRTGRDDERRFGKEELTGLWFMLVNLIRDFLALQGRVTSAWDGWRQLPQAFRAPVENTILIADHIADITRALECPGVTIDIPSDVVTLVDNFPSPDRAVQGPDASA